VFESKKFSVLVADPRHTKVNIKAELNRPGVTTVSDPSNQTRYIDLPPGITPSTIDQLQVKNFLVVKYIVIEKGLIFFFFYNTYSVIVRIIDGQSNISSFDLYNRLKRSCLISRDITGREYNLI